MTTSLKLLNKRYYILMEVETQTGERGSRLVDALHRRFFLIFIFYMRQTQQRETTERVRNKCSTMIIYYIIGICVACVQLSDFAAVHTTEKMKI